jgi:uncharacterized protein (DUF2147 family)
MTFTQIMVRQLIPGALFALLSAASQGATPSSGFEGHWENPKHTTVVNVSLCGGGQEYCAVVLKASAKTQENARKGGTEHFIGTEILRVHAVGPGTFEGTAFDPESNRHVDATVHLVGPGVMELKACALMGLICQEQRWTRVEDTRSKVSTKARPRHSAAHRA